ncbi:hypothetical protein PORY_002242 [Pneumocystis oryctolagi]|uniref:Uncharacterized protein n=1 Tax=Pneumocystis oryctolagi TaxID=42067 RepID=A0ACB7CB27_9ASCO|nr:hypothetical protein PORY_002242 [Pneumocystis oryctolagi]
MEQEEQNQEQEQNQEKEQEQKKLHPEDEKSGSVSAELSTLPPSETVYVRNLSEKIKIPALKESLRTIFSTYGTILDIVAHKNIRMRGQAFIIFDSIDSAKKAVSDVQAFTLFDKPMVLQYSKTKSDIIVKRHGTLEEFEEHKRRRLEKKAQLKPVQTKKQTSSHAAKKSSSKKNPKQRAIPDEHLPPNKILFLQKLPENITAEILSAIFGRFLGFKEVRMVPGRPGIAFVEYETDEDAVVAKHGTVGMSLSGTVISVNFGRK